MMGVDTTFMVQVEIIEAPGHESALRFLESRIVGRDREIAVAPQVLLEFVHIVTDANRFERPLSMPVALQKAQLWWSAQETAQIYPTDRTVSLFIDWMKTYDLGRKRVLDTFLAATYLSNNVAQILTSNVEDFRVLRDVAIVDPALHA